MNRLSVIAILILTSCGIVFAQSSWQREEKTDPLRGTSYSQFSLVGKFLTPPRNAPTANPIMIVRCVSGKHDRGHTNGKFTDGYIYVGGVMDTGASGRGSGIVQFRLDDGKLQSDTFDHSTDFSSIFFRDIQFNVLLYGHFMPHKENTNPQVHKIVIGVSEFLGSEVVMQFDMPDATEVGDACGVIWHK